MIYWSANERVFEVFEEFENVMILRASIAFFTLEGLFAP